MSKRNQDKRRARAKEKKLAKRRLQGTSPLARLADEQHCECWMTKSLDDRMISVHVMRPVRGGQMAGAFFLIDRDCIGLKDAFYRLDMDPAYLRETLRQRSQVEDMHVERIDLNEARKQVAQAISWTRAHPFFRMPFDTERCVKILGGVGDVENADISDFGKDGKLFYVGRKIGLEHRLIGMTVSEFLQQNDVDFLVNEEAYDGLSADDDDDMEEDFEEDEGEFIPELSDEEEPDTEQMEEDFHAMRENLKHKIFDAARRWCFSKAMMPHADLEAAVDLSLAASMEGLGEADEQAAAQKALHAQQILESFEDPAKKESLAAALAQYQQFVESFPSHEAFLSGMGFNDPDVQ
jgi:hypothetical protein